MGATMNHKTSGKDSVMTRIRIQSPGIAVWFGILIAFAFADSSVRGDEIAVSAADAATQGAPATQEASATQNDEQSIVERAAALLRNADHQGTQSLINTYVLSHPDSASGDVLMASAWVLLGRNAEARMALEQFARSAAPGREFECSVALAKLSMLEGRLADAWAHCRLAARATPPPRWSPQYQQQSRFQLQMLTSTVALDRKWFAVAKNLFEIILVDHANDPAALRGFGIAAFHAGDTEVAVEKIKQAGELSPDDDPYQLLIARLHSEAGRLDQADSWFQQSLEADSSRSRTPYLTWLIDNNRPDQAAEHVGCGLPTARRIT
jgi:Flp pilus assembly protein TadD